MIQLQVPPLSCATRNKQLQRAGVDAFRPLHLSRCLHPVYDVTIASMLARVVATERGELFGWRSAILGWRRLAWKVELR